MKVMEGSLPRLATLATSTTESKMHKRTKRFQFLAPFSFSVSLCFLTACSENRDASPTDEESVDVNFTEFKVSFDQKDASHFYLLDPLTKERVDIMTFMGPTMGSIETTNAEGREMRYTFYPHPTGGPLASIVEYQGGKKHGWSYSYSADGALFAKTLFDAGSIIKEERFSKPHIVTE